MTEETFAWFVGVDWGSEKHQVCILDQQGTIVGERHFLHGGAGLAALGDWLLSVAGTVTAVAVGRCTSTIWIAAILSSSALGVRPGARDRSLCFSVTCR